MVVLEWLEKVPKVFDLLAVANSRGSAIDLSRCKGSSAAEEIKSSQRATGLLHKTLMLRDAYFKGYA